VFYIDSDSNQIKQVPVEGGTPEAVPGSTIAGTFLFQHLGFSPDGATLAVAVTLQHKEHPAVPQHKIALIPLNAGTNPTLRFVDPDPRISDYAMFTQDGNALIYAITENGVGNLWAQPIKGGLGHQITNFSSELIGYYQLSRDGKSLLLTVATSNRTSFCCGTSPPYPKDRSSSPSGKTPTPTSPS
jgi:Tol biopolymer transport system component